MLHCYVSGKNHFSPQILNGDYKLVTFIYIDSIFVAIWVISKGNPIMSQLIGVDEGMVQLLSII